jgi:carboxylesterase
MSVVFSLHSTDRQELSVPADNGISLRGPNDHAVFLIHGLTGTPSEMRFLANAFHEKGFSVFCPRLANHGAPLSVLKETRWEEFYESVKSPFLVFRKSFSEIFVGGLSMGALLSLLLAQEFPESVSGVVCLSPTLFYDGWNVPRYRYLLPLCSRSFLKHFFYFREDPPYGLKNRAVRRLVHKYYSQARLDSIDRVAEYGYPFFPVTLLNELDRLVKVVSRTLPLVTVPVQLIQAKDDDMTSVKNSEFIYDRVSSTNKELVLLYNSYHVITADRERDKVVQKMETFFERIITDKAAAKRGLEERVRQ